VKFLERRFVRGAECSREFLRCVCLSALQSLTSKQKATKQPHQSLGGSSFFFALLVLDQLFKGARESGGGVISGANFLHSVRWEGYDLVEHRGTSSEAIPLTHENIPLDITLNRREGGRTQQICIYDAIPIQQRLKQSQRSVPPRNRNTDAPNNPKRPSDASRNAKVSTPASVIGTSAKDLLVNEYEISTDKTAKTARRIIGDPIGG
jgi:hypothetical protein